MRTLMVLLLLSALGYGVFRANRRLEARHRSPAPELASAHVGLQPVEPPAPETPPGFLGVVLTGESVEVASKGEGRIEALFVKTGDQVRRGQPIAQLDVHTQKAELQVVLEQLREARQRFERRRGLLGAISREELSETRSAMLQSQARVQQLQQTVAEARVLAPFDGVVAARYLDVGALVAPGRPIARLLGRGDPKVRFAIPEDAMGQVAPGARVRVHVATANLDLDGVIDSVSPEVDASSRLALGVARLAVPATARLSTGLVAYVRAQQGG